MNSAFGCISGASCGPPVPAHLTPTPDCTQNLAVSAGDEARGVGCTENRRGRPTASGSPVCGAATIRPYPAGRIARTSEAAYTYTVRIVGDKNRSEIELDPLKAYRRGRALDAMLRSAAPPVVRGVMRGSHEHFNRLDAERQTLVASALRDDLKTGIAGRRLLPDTAISGMRIARCFSAIGRARPARRARPPGAMPRQSSPPR